MENEIWKDVIGYEGFYQVSSLGRIKSYDSTIPNRCGTGCRIRTGRIRKVSLMPNGYYFVALYKNKTHEQFYVHRLVASAFLGKSDKKTVNHINGIKADNRPENLEWATQAENNNHARENNLLVAPRGSKQGKAVLDEDFVSEVRRLFKTHTTQEIIDLLGWGKSQRHLIANIRCGRIWKHVA